jgi:transposase
MFRSKQDQLASITIGRQNFKNWDFYVTTFPGHLRLRGRDKRRIIDTMPDGPIGDVQFSMTKTGKLYMHVPVYTPKRSLNPEVQGHLVSLDPGSNPYMTYYSPTRMETGSFGTQKDVNEFRYLQKKIDRINSIMEPQNGNADYMLLRIRRRLRLKTFAIYERSHNLAKDAIDKTINFLTTRFQYVHASEFDLARMVLRETPGDEIRPPTRRNLRKQAVRDLYGWLHYPFKVLLKKKMEVIENLVVELHSEAHTTCACDACGHPNYTVGGNKTFCCLRCPHVAHRDVHAARGHSLRNCVARYTLY